MKKPPAVGLIMSPSLLAFFGVRLHLEEIFGAFSPLSLFFRKDNDSFAKCIPCQYTIVCLCKCNHKYCRFWLLKIVNFVDIFDRSAGGKRAHR